MHPRTNTQFVFNSETVKSEHILLIQMTFKNLINLSMKSVLGGYKMIIYRDRFDLASVIIKELDKAVSLPCDPVKLISLMTWESQPLCEIDCKIVLAHFKSVNNLFITSMDEIESSIKFLKISDRSKTGIISFLKSEQDYYIN